jgi:transcriptional regulator with XRE-family HTH domain
MEISRRFRRLRLQNSLSLAEVAARARLELFVLARFEDGLEVPSWEVLNSLAAALEVPVFEFFCSDGERPPTPWLTPRVTFEELTKEDNFDHPPEPAWLAITTMLLSAIRRASIRLGRRGGR